MMKPLILAMTLLCACSSEPPQQAEDRAAITQCRQEQAKAATPQALIEQREQCDRMQAAYESKWSH